jgi:hypothetical protein
VLGEQLQILQLAERREHSGTIGSLDANSYNNRLDF